MKKNKTFLKLMVKNKNDLYSIIITFFLLIMLSFIFFELSSNAALKNINNLDNPIFTPILLFISVLDLIAFLVVILCSIILTEIYKGFIEKNLKENSIFRICGYSGSRLSFLYSTLFSILSIIIVPIAILGGYFLTIVIHLFLFEYLNIHSSIYIIDSYIFVGIFVLTIVLNFCVAIYTIGYFYRKSLIQILSEARGNKKETLPLIQISIKIHCFFFIIGWINVISSLFLKSTPVIGVLLICITLRKLNVYITNKINKLLPHRNCINTVAISECKYFLQKNNWFIYLYQVSIIISTYILIYICVLKSDCIIGLIAYLVCIFTLSCSLIYKYFLEIYRSTYVYNYCCLLGYSNSQILEIIRKTFKYIITFIFIIPAIFQSILFSLQIIINNYSLNIVLFILVSEVIIFEIMYLIIHKYNNRKHLKGEIK